MDLDGATANVIRQGISDFKSTYILIMMEDEMLAYAAYKLEAIQIHVILDSKVTDANVSN